MEIEKVVIPLAGMGTGLLPATKSQPKEMLPVACKPVVQYVVEEMVDQGLTRFLFITGRDKRSVEDHFDRDHELLNRLSESENRELLDAVDFGRESVRFFFTRQLIPHGRHTPPGIADAIGGAEDFVGNDPFVVALGDTIVKSGSHAGLIRRMIRSHFEHDSGCTIAVVEVDPSEAPNFGIVRPRGRASADFEIQSIVEKPSPADAPSRLAVAARYVFHPGIFDAIRHTLPGPSGKLELTDAIATLIKMGRKVRCVRLKKEELRYGIGDPVSYYKAFIDFAISDQRHGYLIRQHVQKQLREF